MSSSINLLLFNRSFETECPVWLLP